MTEEQVRENFFKNHVEPFIGIHRTSFDVKSEHYIKICTPYNNWLTQFYKDVNAGKAKLIADLPRNSKMYPSKEYAWCQNGASMFAIDAGYAMSLIPCEISCSKAIRMWKAMGRWEENDNYIPKKGDYVYFDWDGTETTDSIGVSAADHVGVVEKVSADGKTLYTVEANASDGSGWNAVCRKTRPRKSVCGYGLPDFASLADGKPEPAPSTTPTPTPTPAPTPTPKTPYPVSLVSMTVGMKRGQKGDYIKTVQALLNVRLGCNLAIDGSFGPATESNLKEYQKRNGLGVDGICGPATLRSLING